MRIDVLPGRYSVHRFEAGSDGPALPRDAAFVSVTRTEHELSIVAPEAWDGGADRTEPGWAAFAVRGPIPFETVGVLAALSRTIADAGVPLFAVSTYDTDVFLVKDSDLDLALEALTAQGHDVRRVPDGG